MEKGIEYTHPIEVKPTTGYEIMVNYVRNLVGLIKNRLETKEGDE